MIFERNNNIERLGEKIGYVFAYFLFTTTLFFILKLLNRIPNFWSYFHIMLITLVIALICVIMDKFLIKREDNPRDIWNSEKYAKD